MEFIDCVRDYGRMVQKKGSILIDGTFKFLDLQKFNAGNERSEV